MHGVEEPRFNYARRQQYFALSRAAATAMPSAGAVLLALAVASTGAVSAAGVLLVLAVGLGLYARHWLSLAERSRVGRALGGRGPACAGAASGGAVAAASFAALAGGAVTRWRSRRPASGS